MQLLCCATCDTCCLVCSQGMYYRPIWGLSIEQYYSSSPPLSAPKLQVPISQGISSKRPPTITAVSLMILSVWVGADITDGHSSQRRRHDSARRPPNHNYRCSHLCWLLHAAVIPPESDAVTVSGCFAW